MFLKAFNTLNKWNDIEDFDKVVLKTLIGSWAAFKTSFGSWGFIEDIDGGDEPQ